MNRRELLQAALAAAPGLSVLPLVRAAEEATPKEELKRKKVLYFTRSVGFEHSVVHRDGGRLSHSERILTEWGKQAGFDVECSKDGAVLDGNLDPYDAFAFYTCGDLTQPGKDPGRPVSAEGKKRLIEAVAQGKGFVGFHSAADTFHSPAGGLDPYVAMLGGEFVAHGAQQSASLVVLPRFPRIGGIGVAEGLSLYDEWYALKNFPKDLHVVLVQETKYMQGDCYRRPNYPCTWARLHGQGRVFYTSLGHREDVWTNPFFRTIALGGFDWVLGRAKADVKPNLDQATPEANQWQAQTAK